MASSKPRVSRSASSSSSSSSSEEHVLDSYEPRAIRSPSASASKVQVFDSSEPLVFLPPSTSSGVVQALDSCDPLALTSLSNTSTVSSAVQVFDSNEPLVLSTSSMSVEESSISQPSSSSGTARHSYSSEIKTWWNFTDLVEKLGTEDKCVQFAEEHGLLPIRKMCSYHKVPMRWEAGSWLGIFRCRKSNCRSKSISKALGTWFENAKIPLVTIFKIMYMFSHSFSYEHVQRETATSNKPVLSHRTIADWFRYCRECVVLYELEHQADTKPMLGGPNKVVQINESKFGKRKDDRGRHIEGHWVIGMIEDRSQDLRLEVCPDNERSAEALLPLIKKHVQEGTIIHTDNWSAYDCLSEHGYIHKKVNTQDGTHTQRIVSQWRVLKKAFRRDQTKMDFADWLVVYNWRRRIRQNHEDPFEHLLTAVKYVYPQSF